MRFKRVLLKLSGEAIAKKGANGETEEIFDCEIIDRQGISYPLAPLYEQLTVKMDEDEEKGHQKVL